MCVCVCVCVWFNWTDTSRLPKFKVIACLFFLWMSFQLKFFCIKLRLEVLGKHTALS